MGKKKSIGAELKEFIFRGNIVDMAVGVIVGTAFGKIVSSLVSDIFMPIIGILTGGIDFTGLKLVIGDATVTYGAFLQNVIDFLIIATCMFFFVKLMARLSHKKAEEKKEEPEPKKSDETVLLEEIRDLLKAEKGK